MADITKQPIVEIITVNRLEFLAALNKCFSGVTVGATTLEGVKNVIIDDGIIHSYNDIISVSVPFQGLKGVKAVVSAEELISVLTKLSAVDLQVEVAETVFKIICGKARIEMILKKDTLLQYIDQVWKDIGKWVKLPTNFREALSLCIFSANSSALAGLYVRDNLVVSTDELRINCYTLAESMTGFKLADTSVKELLEVKEMEKYSISDKWLHIMTADKVVFSCKRQSDESFYEKISGIIAQHTVKEKEVCGTFPKKLGEVVSRASTFHTNINGYKVIMLNLTKDGVECSSNDSQGSYKEVVEWDAPLEKNFKELAIYVDSAVIQYAVERASKFYTKVLQHGEKDHVRIILKDENFLHIFSTVQG